MGRYDILRRIEQLDPQKDHVAIYELTTGYEFPWDITRALEFALYRTYCVPSISALLQKTGELTQYPQKRYDDTTLDAFGFPHPPRWLRRTLALTLKARAYALRWFPPRKKPFIYARDLKHRSYPHGFNLTDLGPYNLLPMLTAQNQLFLKHSLI